MGRFSPTLMDHFESPRNVGRLESPDLTGEASLDGHAPFIALDLRLADGIVQQARFRASGCGVAIAAASALTELVIGRTCAACSHLASSDVAHALDSIPPDKYFCATVAIRALQDALVKRLERVPQLERP